jgi:hypothetical protein
MVTTGIEIGNEMVGTEITSEGLASALTIYIHLEDGRIAQFVQPDTEQACQLLRRIQPYRLFNDDTLIIGGDRSIVAFQTSMVARVELATDLPIDWKHGNNIVSVSEIPVEEFRQRSRSEDYRSQHPEWRPSLHKIVSLFVHLELVNGEQIYAEIRARQFRRTPLEESIALHRLFSTGGLHMRAICGGATIINPACISRIALYPGAEAILPGIWQAAYVGG